MGKGLEAIVEKHKNFEFNERGKIRCTLTGHELPNRKADFLKYLKVSI